MPQPPGAEQKSSAEGPRFSSRFLRLLEPGPEVGGEIARRHARYTRLALSILLPTTLLALVMTILASGDPSLMDEGILVAAFLGFAALVPLSRGRFAVVAANGTLLLTSAAVWAAWWLPATPRGPQTLVYLAVPITLAGLLLPARAAAWFVAINVAAALALPDVLQDSSATHAEALALALLLAILGALSVYSAHVRERDLTRVEEAAVMLEEQDAQRLRMLNTIAHDLASPLTPLKIQLGLIPKDKPLPPERVALIQRNLAHLERLVMDVKDLARLDSGAMKLEPRPVDLGEIVRIAKETFQEDAAGRGLGFDARIEGPLPVVADPDRLAQVTYNLVTNALKFTPAGGRVVIEATQAAGEARIAVRDTGRGLTPEEIARLFQPFSQVHQRHEVKERGTGLGLYISRSIMTAHGGRLDVESEGHGMGSTFILAMPLR